MGEIPVFEMATQYTISALPEGINQHVFAIQVEYRGDGWWAVCRHRSCLNAAGEWSYESIPSERTDEWLADHRFSLETALRLAREACTKLRVNGLSVTDVLALENREAQRHG